jgi:hypothetical protein
VEEADLVGDLAREGHLVGGDQHRQALGLEVADQRQRLPRPLARLGARGAVRAHRREHHVLQDDQVGEEVEGPEHQPEPPPDGDRAASRATRRSAAVLSGGGAASIVHARREPRVLGEHDAPVVAARRRVPTCTPNAESFRSATPVALAQGEPAGTSTACGVV